MLGHTVLEGFVSVDEYHWNLVVVFPAQLQITIDVDILPCETAAALQFRERLFDEFAEMATLAGVHHDLS